MKSHTKLLASIILITTLANTACSKNKETDNIYIPEPVVMTDAPDEIVAYIDNEQLVEWEIRETNKEIDIVKELNYELYNERIDSDLVINSYLNEFENREALENDYLCAVYMKMVNSGTPIEEYLDDLSLMSLYQQVPMCLPEDIWDASFANLIALDPNCRSLFDTYGKFAEYVHTFSCKSEHTVNEFGAYTCDILEKEYTRKLVK